VRITRDKFGPYLRSQRERAGVGLETIAESTKIKQSLLAGLERGDVSHWPAGIFRRAFFREYLTAIGIESEALVADFVRLFPESGAPAADDAFPAQDVSNELRLRLADTPSASTRRRLRAVAIALSDLAVVLGGGWLAAGWLAVSPLSAAAAAAVLYFVAGISLSGETPAAWAFGLAGSRRRRAARVEPGSTEPQLRLVARQPDASRSPGGDAHAPGHVAARDSRRRAR
jgi:hypothetical protein